MALKAMQTRQQASAVTRRSAVVCICSKVSGRVSSSTSVLQQLPQQLATAALTTSLLLAPVGAAEAAKAQQLADLLRDEVSTQTRDSRVGQQQAAAAAAAAVMHTHG